MDKEYALELIEMVPKLLEKKSHLAKEAATYLMRLLSKKKNKTTEDTILFEKCYEIKYNAKY